MYVNLCIHMYSVWLQKVDILSCINIILQSDTHVLILLLELLCLVVFEVFNLLGEWLISTITKALFCSSPQHSGVRKVLLSALSYNNSTHCVYLLHH